MSVATPIFKENRNVSSIVAQPSVTMLAEIPDTQKAFIEAPASSFTESGANFQITNLNSWFVGEIEKVWTRKYTFKGTTINVSGTQANAWNAVTSPMLWSPLNSTVDGFCLNKSTNEIKFNVGNKAWTECDRQNPEMIDIFQLQFDQDKLRTYGIYGENGMAQSVEHNQSFVNGISSIQAPPVRKIIGEASDEPLPYNIAMNSYVNDKSVKNQPTIQNKRGYVRVKSVSYSCKKVVTQGGDPLTYSSTEFKSSPTLVSNGLYTNWNFPGYEGLPVPTYKDKSDSTNEQERIFFNLPTNARLTAPAVGTPPLVAPTQVVNYLADSDCALVQEVELEIHEFIVSPFLSNPYSRNPHKKIYYTNGYPLNLTFQLNKDYVKNSLLKWQPNRNFLLTNTASGNFSNAVVHYMVSDGWSSSLDNQLLRLWTFETSKPLPEVPLKTVYYRQNRQTPFITKLSRQIADQNFSKAHATINTSNLSSLDPYWIVYAGVTQTNNPRYFGNSSRGVLVEGASKNLYLQSDRPYIEFANIDNLMIKVGTQSDVLGSCKKIPKSELVQMTLDVIGNENARQLLEGLEEYYQIHPGSMKATTGTETIASPKIYASIAQERGFPFYIIDVAKLNLRGIDGVPLVPQVNYGNTHFKAVTIEADIEPTYQMNQNRDLVGGIAGDIIKDINVEFNVVLMEQRVRTLPLMSGMMQDDKVEFNIDNVQGDLLSAMNGVYSDDGENQLAYVGGAFTPWQFLKDLYANARSFLGKHAQSVVNRARDVRDFSRGREGLEDLHKMSNVVSHIGEAFGMGKKSKYSRA